MHDLKLVGNILTYLSLIFSGVCVYNVFVITRRKETFFKDIQDYLGDNPEELATKQDIDIINNKFKRAIIRPLTISIILMSITVILAIVGRILIG